MGHLWCGRITVKFLFDTVSFHGEKEHQGVMEPYFPVPGEVPDGVDGILPRIGSDLVDCRQEQSFDDIRIFHKVSP